jgi:hypothetical protein
MKERIDAAPFVVETGAQPGRIMIYLGLTSDGLLLDQHSWQAKMGAPGCRDATGLSGQMAPISVDIPFYEQEGVTGGWKLWVKLWAHSNL